MLCGVLCYAVWFVWCVVWCVVLRANTGVPSPSVPYLFPSFFLRYDAEIRRYRETAAAVPAVQSAVYLSLHLTVVLYRHLETELSAEANALVTLLLGHIAYHNVCIPFKRVCTPYIHYKYTTMHT